MSRVKNCVALFIVMSLCIFLMVGCGDNTDNSEIEGSFIVLKSKTEASLLKVPYDIKGNTSGEKLDELMDVLRNYDKKEYIKPISDEVALLGWNIVDDQVDVYFGENYSELKLSDEVLLRAAIVETLCQLEEVNAVCFYVNENPLAIEGNVIGRMTDDMFINSLLMNEATTSFKLYFPSSDYTELLSETREVKLSNILTDEQAVMDALIKGPDSEGLVRCIPENTKLINIVTKDMICYVNLSGEFLEYLDVPASLTVYSIVNSLCSLPGISSVNITVDDAVVDYYNNCAINENLLYNYELVNEEL